MITVVNRLSNVAAMLFVMDLHAFVSVYLGEYANLYVKESFRDVNVSVM